MKTRYFRANAVAPAEWLSHHLVIKTDTAPEWLSEGPDCVIVPKKTWEVYVLTFKALLYLNAFFLGIAFAEILMHLFRHHP